MGHNHEAENLYMAGPHKQSSAEGARHQSNTADDTSGTKPSNKKGCNSHNAHLKNSFGDHYS